MCERCREALERVGEPMPAQLEFLERVLDRAELTFETYALAGDVVMTPELAGLE